MARLIQWNLVTLDGYFDNSEPWTEPWQIDWFAPVFCDELMSFILGQLASTEAILFGRVTYTGMAAYWQHAEGEVADYMNTLPNSSSPLHSSVYRMETVPPPRRKLGRGN